MATTEQPIMNQSRKRSTPLRARNRGARRARAKNRPASITASAATKSAMRTMPCQRMSRSPAAAISGEGSVKMLPAATFWISERISERRAASAPAVSVSGRLRQSSASMTLFWNRSHSSTSTSAGTPTQIATKAPW